MRTTPLNLERPSLLLAASVLFAGCGAFGEDGERYEKLDRLRVLALRSDPADLSVGETATLSADVYEPAERALSYAWSWCPSRADSTGGFACNISEEDLGRAWTAAGLDGPAPTYELGTDSEAQFTHVLAPSVLLALCQSPELDERQMLACFTGFEPSVELTVRTSEAELTAIKSLTLLMDETPEAERNSNPASDFDLTLRDDADGAVVESDQPLRAGHRYTVTAEVDDGAAEPFTPSALPGEPVLDQRRETLVMSWFVTVGDLVAPGGSDEGIGDDDRTRTTFVDGRNEVEDLRKNGWEIPLNAGPRAELHLVLRDERGGTGWTARSFAVVGGEQ
jgi:hypothetical protein